MDEHIINILWAGPYSFAELAYMDKPEDKGLYQVYAHHPLYGAALVYIGQTKDSFSQRPHYPKPEEQWESGSENDPGNVCYYVGRLIGKETPTEKDWNRDISCAESLLIHAHSPAYNSDFIKNPPDENKCGHVRVINWGAVRSLQREVSGWVWTHRGEEHKTYQVYGKCLDKAASPAVQPTSQLSPPGGRTS